MRLLNIQVVWKKRPMTKRMRRAERPRPTARKRYR